MGEETVTKPTLFLQARKTMPTAVKELATQG